MKILVANKKARVNCFYEPQIKFCAPPLNAWGRGGVVVSTLDLRSEGWWF